MNIILNRVFLALHFNEPTVNRRGAIKVERPQLVIYLPLNPLCRFLFRRKATNRDFIPVLRK